MFKNFPGRFGIKLRFNSLTADGKEGFESFLNTDWIVTLKKGRFRQNNICIPTKFTVMSVDGDKEITVIKSAFLRLWIGHAGKWIMAHGNPCLDGVRILTVHGGEEEMLQPWALIKMGVLPAYTITPFNIRLGAIQVANPLDTTVSRPFRDKQAEVRPKRTKR